MRHFLFITDYLNPFEPTFGGAQRSNLLLSAFLKLGQVDVVSFTDGISSNIDGCKVLYSKDIHSYPHMSRKEKWLGLLRIGNPYSFFPICTEKEQIVDSFIEKNHYDAIIVRFIPEAMLFGLMKYADRLIIDVDDHPKDTLRNKALQCPTSLNKIYYYLASIFSNIAVKVIANKIMAALFPNPMQVVGRNGFYLPNIPFDNPETEYVNFKETTPRLFFVGRLDYYPNYLGIDWFIDNVWHYIIDAIPQAELRIGGKYVHENVVQPYFHKWENIKGVTIIGFIKNLNEEYEKCRATISPIFIGAGTNIKLIESMQRKRVCITTECGIRGMRSFLVPEKDILFTSNPKEYAELCIKVLTDESYNHKIAQGAFSIVENFFSKQSFNRTIKKILNNNEYSS